MSTKRLRTPVTFEDACSQLDVALNGNARREIVDVALGGGNDESFERLRSAMRTNSFPTASGSLVFRRIVDSFDAKSRREGMHVIQGWDFKAHRFTADITPVLLLDYCARLKRRADDRTTLAVLLDQYFLAVLSLLAVRAWDDGDPNTNLDRVSALVRAVRGPCGSGHAFVDDAETLLFLAVSYFHPDEASYDLLLEKVGRLDAAHQLRVAAPSGAMLAAHLRWGLRFMYGRDLGMMRSDNVADYPWLLFAVDTLARAGETRGLLDALSADPWTFTGAPPESLAQHAARHTALRDLLRQRGEAFLADVATMMPATSAYSPLSFSANFPTNASVATVAVALEDGRSYPSLNALLGTGGAEGGTGELAERLMKYSASDPSRLGAGGSPLIVYDPTDGAHAYNAVVKTLRVFLKSG